MNQNFGLQFGPLTVNVVCETPLHEAFSFIYGHLVVPSFSQSNLTIRYEEDLIYYQFEDTSDHHVIVKDNRQKIACFSALILKALSSLYPDDLIFHGNALVNSDPSHGILLLGKSGLGKTTLSRILMADHGYRSYAEDLIIIHARAGILPYPRAFGIRGEKPSHAREFFGKVWEPHPGTIDSKFPEIGKVIFLNSQESPAEEKSSSGSTTWATYSEIIDHQYLESYNLPVESITTQNDILCITYREELSPSLRKIEHEILTQVNSLIFQTSQKKISISDVHERPSVPRTRAISNHTGLEYLIDHMILPSIESLQIPLGLRLFTAAKSFSDYQFIELTPGGTPTQTVDELLKFIRV